MDIKNLETQIKRDFNNTVYLIGIIPFLVFVYILLVLGKFISSRVFSGEVAYLILIVTVLLMLGIITGRKMFWALIKRLLEFNQQITELQRELIEKSRLAAISETTLTLSHEIKNPLMVISVNLELLENDFKQTSFPQEVKERFTKIEEQFERIKQATEKLSSLSEPITRTVYEDRKIIDLGKSR